MRPLALFLGFLAAWLVICRLVKPRVGTRPVYLSSAVLGAVLVAVALIAECTEYSAQLALPYYAILADVMVCGTQRVAGGGCVEWLPL